MDVEAELLKEAKQDKVKDERMFHIFETGIEQTFFMEMRSDFDSTEITDRMWEDILNDKIGNNVLAPRCIGRTTTRRIWVRGSRVRSNIDFRAGSAYK